MARRLARHSKFPLIPEEQGIFSILPVKRRFGTEK
jgi:hypothetical protein